ncbi:glycine--tRNA ligase [Daktulosphaira vitifoliae]|uniref:glycine--tRNA ligase n=1 Tax=Daktulosphaira vitifoliae TaxID=58002 RepID=UPI0021A97981|nr:glycine--tRNA ligase [Daktulosphaira vitifoliae]
MSRLQSRYLKTYIQFFLYKTSYVSLSQSKSHRFFGKLTNWGTKKSDKNIKLVYLSSEMANSEVEQTLAPLRAAVKKQGDLIRSLKENKASDVEIKIAVGELKLLKKQLDDKELSLQPPSETFNRSKFSDLLIRRFFYDQSFSIYGGVAGLYDFGPMGCALKSNILEQWKRFFVLEDQMLEIDCSMLTPERVLQTSGHVEKFADTMVKDKKTGECFRLDHLIKNRLEVLIKDKKTTTEIKDECKDIVIKLDGMTTQQMSDIVDKFKMKSPTTGNDLSEPIDFNLMFATQIGPTGDQKGFLRPETAQGIFVNFKRLLEFNQGRLPFAAAQIGNAFRNEISPRSGLLRVREFTMAEIEHFCDPSDKSHPKFNEVENTKLKLYSACNQMDGKSPIEITIGQAVSEGLVANQTLGYFMARIHLFMLKIGINKEKLRFRQHMSNEMAHYAVDCWDAECLTSYGWVECIGCADRSAYDLSRHGEETKQRLVAERKLPAPKNIQVIELDMDKGLIGKTLRKDSKECVDKLSKLSIDEVKQLHDFIDKSTPDPKTGLTSCNIGDKQFELSKNMIPLKCYSKTIHVEEIIPNVIEPSFGIGRIIYTLLEHTFKIREKDEQRTYLTLPSLVAPLKCCVLPLLDNEKFVPLVSAISKSLCLKGISNKIDDSSGSVGRRYARTDEIAVPYCITVDFESLNEPQSVTIRERDSMEQIRVPVAEVVDLIYDLSQDNINWDVAMTKYPKFESQQNE